jgi:hypothetical protein
MAKSKLPPFAKTAQLVQTLVFYDGPQVVLMKSDRGLDILAIACEYTGMEYPFFACEISPKTLTRYSEQRIDLNYAFRFREVGKKHYFFDWVLMDDNKVTLKRATVSEVINDDYYPDPGFFSRDHTNSLKSSYLSVDSTHTYAIDGKWSAPDFSHFYGKIADLYAFSAVASKDVRNRIGVLALLSIKRTIASYAWRGGGSYVGFYDDIFSQVQKINPLSVEKIRYASPGTIELRGGNQALGEIDSLLAVFSSSEGDITKFAKTIDRALSFNGFKAKDKEDILVTDTMKSFFTTRSKALLAKMGFADSDSLLELCDDNPIVFAKISLSIYRRIKALQTFQAEGRVKVDVVSASSPSIDD